MLLFKLLLDGRARTLAHVSMHYKYELPKETCQAGEGWWESIHGGIKAQKKQQHCLDMHRKTHRELLHVTRREMRAPTRDKEGDESSDR